MKEIKVENKSKAKVVMVGSKGVGKTAIFRCFANLCYPDETEKLLRGNFDSVERVLNYQGEEVKFSLHETSSSDEDYLRRVLAYEDADLVIIVFAKDDPMSLIEVGRKFHPEVIENLPGTRIMLLGNKADTTDQDNPWAMSDRAERVCRDLKIDSYMECQTIPNENGISPRHHLLTLFEKVLELSVDPDPGFYSYESYEYGRVGYMFQLCGLSLILPFLVPVFAWEELKSGWRNERRRSHFLKEVICDSGFYCPCLLSILLCVFYPIVVCCGCIASCFYVCFCGDWEEGGCCWGKKVIRRKSKNARCVIL